MINDKLKLISEKLIARQQVLTTAESCTGGLVASWITDLPGSSKWFERGLVTYSNQAKMDLLRIKPETLEEFGAVSLEVAQQMALGCLTNSPADYALSITGIAGPSGGTEQKPVGMVCFGWAKWLNQKVNTQPQIISETQFFDGDRKSIREGAAKFALNRLAEFI